MKALIDGDIIVYRAGFAAERMKYGVFVPPEDDFRATFDSKKEAMEWIKDQELIEDCLIDKWRDLQPVNHAFHNVNLIVEHVMDEVSKAFAHKSEVEFEIVLSGESNFRHDIAVTRPYKGNRDPNQQPTYKEQIKRFLREHWGAKVVEGIEADDYLGIVQCSSKEGSTIICTLDKDLDMIPGWHYNWVKEDFYNVFPDEAIRIYWTQVLTGDSTDNIEGIPGIGPKKARPLVDQWEGELRYQIKDPTIEELNNHLRSEVVEYYCDYFGDEGRSRFDEMSNLVWILREPLEEDYHDPEGEQEEGTVQQA